MPKDSPTSSFRIRVVVTTRLWPDKNGHMPKRTTPPPFLSHDTCDRTPYLGTRLHSSQGVGVSSPPGICLTCEISLSSVSILRQPLASRCTIVSTRFHTRPCNTNHENIFWGGAYNSFFRSLQDLRSSREKSHFPENCELISSPGQALDEFKTDYRFLQRLRVGSFLGIFFRRNRTKKSRKSRQ